ncbi:MAG: hypothetical protein AVDCRST_MAG53-2950, partial [uncultured Solirubrobacteraceae bacterium]
RRRSSRRTSWPRSACAWTRTPSPKKCKSTRASARNRSRPRAASKATAAS